MDCPALMALSLKLYISCQVPIKLSILLESLPALMVMPNRLNHAGVAHNTLESAIDLNQISGGLLNIPTNPLSKHQILSNSVGMLDKTYMEN